MYPVKFKPIYKERIWGGRSLQERFGRDLPEGRIGESWDVSCHPNGTSVISNGPWVGQTLDHVSRHFGRQILGTALRDGDVTKFPLLMKLLDASDNLSVQVHPSDVYAGENENGELGKSELWYILDAEPGARIVYGLVPGTEKKDLAEALKAGNPENLFNWVEVHPGEVYDIPAGLIHALGAGVMVAEIQQNSDTTYRVHDFNRVDESGNPRELHIEKALDVIDFSGTTLKGPVKGLLVEESEYYSRRLMTAGKYFAVELIDLLKEGDDGGNYAEGSTTLHFSILTCTAGSCTISGNFGDTPLASGESCFIPSGMSRYELIPEGTPCTIMKSYVPDLEHDIIKALREAGYQPDVARGLIGGLS